MEITKSEILEKTKDLSLSFKCLGDFNRVRILTTLLYDGEQTVSSLAKQFPEISRPTISHHLALLKNSGLVGFRKEGKEHYYFITCDDFTSKLNSWVKIINEL